MRLPGSMPAWGVIFSCGHRACILDDEHGDGSAWCQQCGEFRDYMDECDGSASCRAPVHIDGCFGQGIAS